jgi:hypothetical protein
LARAARRLLHVLMLPDFDRADAIGSYWGNPRTRTFFGNAGSDASDDQEGRGSWLASDWSERGRPLGVHASQRSDWVSVLALIVVAFVLALIVLDLALIVVIFGLVAF